MKRLSLLFLSFFVIGLIYTPVLVATTISSTGTNPGTVSNAGVATGGALWSATTTWVGGVVPGAADDVIIVSPDLVIGGGNASSLTVQNGAKVSQTASVTCTTGGTFTLASGSWWYASYGSATKLPQGFGTYSIDPNSNYVFTTAASSSLVNATPALYGNVFVYKTGSVFAAATAITSINIQGNLTVNVSGSTLKSTNNKSDVATTIHVGGNVYVIAGVLTGVDAVGQNTSCTYNIDGSVFVGDASTALGVAGLAGVSSPDAGWLRTATFNITGNLSYINGAKFEAGTSSTSTNTSELVNINLQGNLSTDATVVIATNTLGTFVFSFVGTNAQTMTLGERLKFSPATIFTLSINKSAGDVTINNSVDSINGTLNLTSGNLVLAGNALVVTTISGGSASSHIVFDAAGNGSVALDVPASTNALLLPVGTAAYYTPLTLQYPVAPIAGVITLSKVTPGMDGVDMPALNDAGYILTRRSEQYWSYSNTASGSSYTLSIDGSSSQTGIDDPSNLRVIHSADGTTFDLIGTHSAGSGSTAVRTVIPDGTSGRFYLGGRDPGNNPLPVELSSFTSNVNGRDIQLNWTTKTEVNSNKFVIEHALVNTKDAAVTWTSIGTIQASGTSNSPKQYSYSDTKLQSGKYQYRLRMIDNDGSYKYSNVVETEIALPKNFELSQNYPNPFNPSTKIDYQVPVDAKVVMEVYNIAGQKVFELVNQEQSAGYYTVDFGASKLSSGVYIYRIVANDKATGNNFSSIKKMMLLK
jgi:hypothetical protein